MTAKKPPPKGIPLEHEIREETQLPDYRRKLNRAARKSVVGTDVWEDELLRIAEAHLKPPDLKLQYIQQAFDALRAKTGKAPSQRAVADRSGYSRETVRDRWPRLKR